MVLKDVSVNTQFFKVYICLFIIINNYDVYRTEQKE